MALSTIVQLIVSENIDLSNKTNILVAYTMGFGSIPSIKETNLGVIINDVSHRLNMTLRNNFLLESSISPEEMNQYIPGFKRFLGILGGGEIKCSTEYDDLAPLKETYVVKTIKDFEKVLSNNIEDFEKFLNKPFDDKGFLTTTKWTPLLEKKYVAAVAVIDEWFFTKITVEQSIKYLVYKLNIENFCLFAFKEGAIDIEDIKNRVDELLADYFSYLGRYDEEIFAAMKKGLKNIHSLSAKTA